MTSSPSLDYECRGAGSPLLFIHGLTFDRSTWDPIVDQLADRFTCITVDLPGHGGSEGPPRLLDELAAAIHQLVAQLELGPPVVVGHSLGAALAGTYAAHQPARGLVTVDQAPYILPFATMLQQFEPALRSDFRAAFEPIRQTIGIELLPEPQRSSILARQRIAQDLVLGYWGEVLHTSAEEMQARVDRDCKAIGVPVLALFGHVIDPATREHLHGVIPHAQIEEWDGLGHMTHLMDPKRFAGRLADFAHQCFSTTLTAGAPNQRIDRTSYRNPQIGGSMSKSTARPASIDWGLGDYETLAVELEPAATHVVAIADLVAGERVLDIATGTGNAALAAARAGTATTGVDAAPRLIKIARQRAASEGLDVSFLVGDLHGLSLPAESFDCVMSVFGIIFATDPHRAAAEFMRMVAPGGRGLISVWVPAGPIDAMIGVWMRAVARAAGAQQNRFAWNDEDAVRALFAPYGVELRWHEGAVQFTAGSPEEYLDRQRSHPISLAMLPLLEAAGTATAAYEEALAVLHARNERADAFLGTYPYRVIEINRPS